MIRLFLLLVLGSFFSIGCAGLGPKLQFTDTQDNALVVGYLDTDKTPRLACRERRRGVIYRAGESVAERIH